MVPAQTFIRTRMLCIMVPLAVPLAFVEGAEEVDRIEEDEGGEWRRDEEWEGLRLRSRTTRTSVDMDLDIALGTDIGMVTVTDASTSTSTVHLTTQRTGSNLIARPSVARSLVLDPSLVLVLVLSLVLALDRNLIRSKRTKNVPSIASIIIEDTICADLDADAGPRVDLDIIIPATHTDTYTDMVALTVLLANTTRSTSTSVTRLRRHLLLARGHLPRRLCLA